jgi:hypothetical protein
MLQAGRSPVRVPDEVDFFNVPNPSSRTMVPGWTQPLTKMSIRHLPGGRSGSRVGLTTLPPYVSRMSENVGASTFRNPKGLHGLYRDNFNFTLLLLKLKGKAIPVTVPWRSIGLWDVEVPTFSLDNWLTDGGKVVSLTRLPPLTPSGKFLLLISVRGWVDPRAIVRLEGLLKLKISTSPVLEPATFRLVAKCLNQLRYRVPQYYYY